MNILLADKSTVDCTDGASNTILLSEVNGLGDIPWTTGALTFVGYQESSHGHMVNVLFADGHVAFVDGRNEQVMTAWGTPSGGEF